MNIKFLLITFLLLNLFRVQSQDTLRHSIYFDVDKFDLKANEKSSLDAFLKTIDVPNILSIELSGHTDSDGSNAYNQKLSLNRVRAVENYLTSIILKTSTSFEFGELKPVAANANENGKAKNRRVEVTIIVQEPPTIQIHDIKELYKQLEQKKQHYCIDPNRDTVVLMDQGTILFIQSGTFVNQKGCVTISAKEVYKKSDMLLENLSTMSYGKQLESGGMIYIEATSTSGNTLNPIKDISIFMPTQDYKEDMKLFKGSRNAHNEMNWSGIDQGLLKIGPSDLSECGEMNEATNCGPSCRLFCRIGRIGNGIGGLINKNIRKDNQQFRKCQRNMRKSSRRLRKNIEPSFGLPSKCDSIRRLMEKYGVNNFNDLQLKMNKGLMDSLGLTTLEELQEELTKQRNRKIEKEISSGQSTVETLSYYSFQTKQMGWINCDRFSSDPGPKINMETPEKIKENKDCKLVFDVIHSVMSPSYMNTPAYHFDNIPKDAMVHLVYLRYEAGIIYVSIHAMKVQEKAPEPNWEKVSLDELKEIFKQFDQ
ncbi:MAG: hypothetical protein RI922_2315 [Bacteroidota bacterium]|jgi:hypothetical protein